MADGVVSIRGTQIPFSDEGLSREPIERLHVRNATGRNNAPLPGSDLTDFARDSPEGVPH